MLRLAGIPAAAPPGRLRHGEPHMNVVVIGAGPAGLYFSYLLKRRQPSARVRVFEQNPAGATFGFGVVFSDRALEFLKGDDPETYALITPAMESWSDMTLDLCGEVVTLDGVGFSAVGRLRLLQLLQQRVESTRVELEFSHGVRSLAEIEGADLIVGADGLNSMVRQSAERDFGTSIRYLDNRFAWYGTTRRFESLTQTFRRTPQGCFNAHHYRYAPAMSTFIVETDARTWERAGLEKMPPDESRAFLESVFADTLQGCPLVSNNSMWRRFPVLANARWSAGRRVLLGDALHTAHFSIGSGTRLAMEDAIELVAALERHPDDVPAALADYERTRRPVLATLVEAANASAGWYENFAQHMALRPLDFAVSYITRSGRVDFDRLARVAPRFVAACRAAGVL